MSIILKSGNSVDLAFVSAAGALKVDNSGVTQPVSGTVAISGGVSVTGTIAVSNFPASQTVNGTISVSNFPATQPVSGAVSISNFPATQPVSLAAAVDVSDRAVRLLGHVTMDNSSIAVTGTFFQATQPVSIAAAVAVTGTFFQATQPVSVVALPLPSGASTSALQTTGNSLLSSIDTKTPALVTGRVPVDGSGVTQPISGSISVSNFPATQPVSGSISVSNFPATQAVTGTFFQATQPVSLAAAVDVSDRAARLIGHVTVDNASLAVTGTFFQATQPVSIAASVAVTGTFFQATQPISAAALPLPSGAATAANQTTELASLATIVTNTGNVPPPTAKGTQGVTAQPVQNLKDAGRSYFTLTALAAAGVTAEALFTFSQNKAGTVTPSVTSYTITNGKILRIQSVTISVRAGAAAVPFSRCVLRSNTGGATVVGSNVVYDFGEVFGIAATIGVGGSMTINFPDGLEIAGNGTISIGVSHLDQATTNVLNFTLCGYEY